MNNPLFPSVRSSRSFRGGCWRETPWLIRVSVLDGFDAFARYRDLGFRVVRTKDKA